MSTADEHLQSYREKRLANARRQVEAKIASEREIVEEYLKWLIEKGGSMLQFAKQKGIKPSRMRILCEDYDLPTRNAIDGKVMQRFMRKSNKVHDAILLENCNCTACRHIRPAIERWRKK